MTSAGYKFIRGELTNWPGGLNLLRMKQGDSAEMRDGVDREGSELCRDDKMESLLSRYQLVGGRIAQVSVWKGREVAGGKCPVSAIGELT